MHKALALRFLHQNKIYVYVPAEDEVPKDLSLNEDDNMGLNIGNDGLDFDTVLCPPNSDKALIQMIEYMKKYKRIPFPLPDWMTNLNTSQIPISLKPAENLCISCNYSLSGPYRITHKAKILVMQGLIDGVETFFKFCKKCNRFYRY